MAVASGSEGATRRLLPYIAFVAAAGVASLAATAYAFARWPTPFPAFGPAPFWVAFAVAAALLFVLHRAALILHWRGHRMIVTLEEGLLYVLLVSPFPALLVPAVVFFASAAAQALGRREPRKAIFNIGSMSLTAAGTAVTFIVLLSAGVPPAVAALPAIGVYSLLSNLLVAGVFSVLERANPLKVFVERFGYITVGHAALGASLGIATFALWTLHPVALLALAPLAYFGNGYVHLSAQTDRELLVHRRLTDMTTELVGTKDVDVVADRVLAVSGDLFHAGRATIRLSDGRVWTRDFEGGPDLARRHLSAPLVGRDGEEIGTIRVDPTRRTREPYGVLEQEMLRMVAGQTAATLAAARVLHELAESESRVGLILSSAGEGILGVDMDDRIIFANPAAERLLGYDPGELSGRQSHETIHHSRADGTPLARDDCPVRWTLQQKSVASPDQVFWRKDGRSVPVEYVAAPMTRGDALSGSVVVFTDVTERRRAEEAQRVAIERAMEIDRLKEVNQFRTQLLNTASHELNTPLTPIRLQLHLLKSSTLGTMTERQMRALTVVDRNVERLSILIQDVLDVARLQSGRLRVAKEPLDLNDVVAEAVEAFREPARQARVQLDMRHDVGVWVEADPHRVTQILFNYLSNALKFTPAGGRVLVETRNEGKTAVVRVVDTGAGLTAAQIERLFEPFSQVHESSVAMGGTGLGLYITKGIVEEHGGTAWCESAGPGMGSTFAIRLPLLAKAVPNSLLVVPRQPPPAPGILP